MARPVLSINSCFATKRWPEADSFLGIAAKDLALNRLQLSSDLLNPSDAGTFADDLRGIARSARETGVTIASIFTGGKIYNENMLLHPSLSRRMSALKEYEAMIVAGAALGCSAFGGHLGAYSVRDYVDRARRNYLEGMLMEFIEHLSSLAERTNCLKTLLWEPMPVAREIPHSTAETRRLLEQANKRSHIPVRACLDLGHCCAADLEDPAEHDVLYWLRELGDLIGMVHLQQTDGKGDHHWPFNRSYNSEGLIAPEVARAIRRWAESIHGEEIEMPLELIHPAECPDAQVLNDLVESVAWWKEILA